MSVFEFPSSLHSEINLSAIILFTDIDYCINHTCQNGASCVDGLHNYSCKCPTGYTGSNCESGKFLLLLFSLSYCGFIQFYFYFFIIIAFFLFCFAIVHFNEIPASAFSFVNLIKCFKG